MSQIKNRDTKPELKLRKYLWTKKLRGYRLKSKIVGKPDLYFPKQKVAIFIDGCFWHKCPKCFIEPKTNKKFWSNKIMDNLTRDKKVNALLAKQKIRNLRIWEHEIREELHSCYVKTYNIIYQ